MSNTKKKLDLNMIDERDHGRIQYKRVNSDTGKEVPWKHITKGYEYADEEYLALDKDTLSESSNINPRARPHPHRYPRSNPNPIPNLNP